MTHLEKKDREEIFAEIKLIYKTKEKLFQELVLVLDESSDSAIHTVYERIKGIKGYKMT